MLRHLQYVVPLSLLAFPASGARLFAQPSLLPPGDNEPILRLQTGGPTSYVTALAFSPDGSTLYAAGWDKVVHVWSRDAGTGRFLPVPSAAFRLPVGPGLQGAINAMAIAPDGQWLAVGGPGIIRDTAGFRQHGLMAAAQGTLTRTMRQDEGLIYVFHTATREVRLLRRQLGPTWALAFAPGHPQKPPLLVSSAREWDEEDQKFVGSLRVWNVADGTQVSGYFALPGDLRVRPSLAAWHTGNGLTDLRVAAVWGESQLLVWDVRTEKFDRIATEQAQLHLAALGNRRGFVTGGAGQVIHWNTEGAGLPTASARIPLPQGQFAAAGCVVPRPGAPEQTAIVTVDPQDARSPRLAVVDLQAGKVVASTEPIWRNGGAQPVLAAAGDGVHLAAAGNRDHDVLVYRTAELHARGAAPQRLRGFGVTFRYAAFARRAGAPGIVLSETPGPQVAAAPPAGSLVLDVAERTISATLDGWSLDQPRVADWQVESTVVGTGESQRVQLLIRAPGRPETQVRLDKGQQLSAFAVTPTVMGTGTPILAIAAHELGQPILRLFNAANGQALRQLTGHTERIGSLAFSADGRLLVSTADDRTVAVWSLVDLVGQHLGRRGRIVGLSVAERDGHLIAQVDAETATFGQALQTGDILLGIVRGEQLQAFKTATELANALAQKAPGESVVVRRARNGAPADVPIRLGQAIDERKPLFTLFVTDLASDVAAGTGGPVDAAKRTLDWIGYTPIGPYESSHRRIERLLGWHFNTGKAEAPTAFAVAEVYRKTYYRAGLLADLVRDGAYRPTAARPPIARPKMTLLITDANGEPIDAQTADGLLVQRLPATLHLSAYGIESDQVLQAQWRSDGGAWQPLVSRDELHWSADVTAALRARGVHRLEVALRTSEDQPQTFTAQLPVRRQPPAPTIVVEAPVEKQTLQQPLVDFVATVKELAAGEPAVIALSHRHNGKEVHKQEWAVERPGPIRAQLKLEAGTNVFELSASNKGPEAAAAETVRLVRSVTYSPAMTTPPSVAVRLLDTANPPQPIPFDRAGQIYRSAAPMVRIAGRITAEDSIAQANFSAGGAESRAFTGFQPGTVTQVAIDESVSLQPGANIVVLSAKSKTSVAVQERLVIQYRPPVPDVQIVAPADGTVLIEGRDAARVKLEAQWAASEPAAPFQLRVLANGRPVETQLSIDTKKRTAAIELPLTPGDSHLAVQVSNEWGSARTTDLVTVTYRRPPRIVRLEHLPLGTRPFVDVRAEIETPADVPLTEVRLQGQPLPERSFQRSATKNGRSTWRVTADDVPLEKGENRLVLSAANADGAALEPAALTVAYAPTPPQKAEIDVVEPASSIAVTSPELAVEFRIRSGTPLQAYGVYDGSEALFTPQTLAASRDADGAFLVRARPTIRLKRGTNYLTIRARNDGGEATASLVVSHVYTPVQFAIRQLASADGTKIARPRSVEQNRIAFTDPFPDGVATVSGELIWNDPSDKRLTEAQWLRLFVNGFQQTPARLQPAEGSTRKFQARIVCSQAKQNRVAFVLPGLEYDAASRTEFTLDVTNPVRDQQLHLLVVGPGERNRGRLAQRALEALHIKPGANESAGPFSAVHVYGPLVDFVSPQKVMTQFERIRAAIALRGQAGARNDVVMVFFQGEESLGSAGQFFLLTSDSQFDPRLERSAIGSEDLGRFFARTPGAHVLLLDVARSGDQARRRLAVGRDYDNWPEESHVGVLRYAWRQPKNIPEDSRLVLALEQAPPTASRLKEVETEIARRSGELASASPGLLVYERFLPSDLENLLLRGP